MPLKTDGERAELLRVATRLMAGTVVAASTGTGLLVNTLNPEAAVDLAEKLIAEVDRRTRTVG